MFLVLGEKPSVAQALAEVLGAKKRADGYLEGEDCIVSWCLGHLAEYAAPEVYDERYKKWEFADLPILPKAWELRIAKDKKEQFDVLKELLNRKDLEYVVNACDAGREGELIFKRVYDLSKSSLPVKRLWISSMEEQAICDGFSNLKNGKEYERLCEAAVCRAKADWLVGMNATRAFTTTYYKRMVVGRVQTPTLAMLVERQKKVENFEKEAYYQVELPVLDFFVTSEKMKKEEEADTLVKMCEGNPIHILKVERKQKKTNPPKLYDLTTLQREANRFFGYTAQETLTELQKLYEEKWVTYPRTDSQYITEDMEQSVLELLDILSDMLPFCSRELVGRNVGAIINNQKVSDHHALLPTKEAWKQDIGALSKKQKDIFYLIGQRLAQAVSEAAIFEETEVSAECADHLFATKGKRVVEPGFQKILKAFQENVRKTEEMGEKEEKVSIPENISDGMEIAGRTPEKRKRFTAPPKPYSEDTLLSAMETAGNHSFDVETEKKGLGTPATRAGIIEKLVSSGYAVRKGKQLLPTKEGIALISVLPEELKSAVLTAEWENELLRMERGEVTSETFMEDITEFVQKLIAGCREIPKEERYRFYEKESIGKCPVCGSPVYEGKKNFYCSSHDCNFALWKESRYLVGMEKTLDQKMAKELLEHGKARVTDFYSQRTGKKFTADLLLELQGDRASFKMEFPKRK